MPIELKRLLRDATDAECYEALDRLMRDGGIEPGDYKTLARQLATKYVSEFQPAQWVLEHGDYGAIIRQKGRGGRPIKWTPDELDNLASAVNDAKQKHGLATDEEALWYITRQGRWSCPLSRERTKWLKTLKNMLAAERKAQRGANLLFEIIENVRRDNPE